MDIKREGASWLDKLRLQEFLPASRLYKHVPYEHKRTRTRAIRKSLGFENNFF